MINRQTKELLYMESLFRMSETYVFTELKDKILTIVR